MDQGQGQSTGTGVHRAGAGGKNGPTGARLYCAPMRRCTEPAGFSHAQLALLVMVLAPLWVSAGGADQNATGLHRGTFVNHQFLTGRIEAVDSVILSVPRSPVWRNTVTWLAEEGTSVKKGDKVGELDSSTFRSSLQDRRLDLLKAKVALQKARAQAEAAQLDAELAVAQAETALETARLDATVPEKLLPRREAEERTLTQNRAKAKLESTKARLQATTRQGQADIEIADLSLRKADRAVREAEEAIERFMLYAPRDGVVVIPDHPWERRKIGVGDMLFVGAAVVEIASLDHLRIRAMLPDVDDGTVEPGMHTVCTPDMHPDLRIEGTVRSVTQVARQPDRGSQRRVFEVIVELDEQPPVALQPGMLVRVDVETARLNDVLTVPRSRLVWDEGEARIRSDKDGAGTPVALGPCNAQECVVREEATTSEKTARSTP